MKTIEQRATAYAAGLTKTPGYDPAIRLAYIKGAEDALRSQWRSVKDELPENGKQCVIMDMFGRMRTAVYSAVNRYWEMNTPTTVYIHKVTTVVAWMPIPEYKGKEADNG